MSTNIKTVQNIMSTNMYYRVCINIVGAVMYIVCPQPMYIVNFIYTLHISRYGIRKLERKEEKKQTKKTLNDDKPKFCVWVAFSSYQLAEMYFIFFWFVMHFIIRPTFIRVEFHTKLFFEHKIESFSSFLVSLLNFRQDHHRMSDSTKTFKMKWKEKKNI